MTNQTNTTFFTCTATSAVTFETKKFFSIFANKAHEAAREWLKEQDKKAA
jgi:hypothetical protein